MRSNRLAAMTELIAASFRLPEYECQPFDKQNYRQLFDKWAAGQGAAHLFVYYQKPYRVTEQGDIEVSERQPHEFIVTDGNNIKLRGKGVFFMRNTKPGVKINETVVSDD